jgi:hypothetical protein
MESDKPKRTRVMTEDTLKKLAEARVKASEARAREREIRDKEKAIKDSEKEKKVKEIEEKFKSLSAPIDIPLPKEVPKPTLVPKEVEREYLIKKPKKKKIIIEDSSSSSDDEVVYRRIKKDHKVKESEIYTEPPITHDLLSNAHIQKEMAKLRKEMASKMLFRAY